MILLLMQLPSFVLNFAYAEALELQGNFAEVHAVYEKFLGILRKDLEAIEAKINASNSSSSSKDSNAMDVTPQPGTQSQHSSFNTQSSDDRPPKNKELTDKRTDYGIAWIMYIRFARRAEGLKSARNVFGKARRDRLTPWEVHESEGASFADARFTPISKPLSTALMEYHCGNKDVQVASRIFEKGMEQFGDEVEYVLIFICRVIQSPDNKGGLIRVRTYPYIHK